MTAHRLTRAALPTAIALLFAFASPTDARQDPAPACPDVSTSSPDTVPFGSPAAFTGSVRGGDANVTPTYSWTVSAGTIESGQGTSSITVNTSGLDSNATITATVDVGGYARECSTSSSCTITIVAKPPARGA
jgi:hypothetical protein